MVVEEDVLDGASVPEAEESVVEIAEEIPDDSAVDTTEDRLSVKLADGAAVAESESDMAARGEGCAQAASAADNVANP